MISMPHWPIPLGFKPIDLGLERIRTVLNRLGNPEQKLPPVVHVAGTNGKGSTIAFMQAILEAAGYKVHVYTSPHLVMFNERIILAGEMISDEMLYEVLEECRIAAEDTPVTFFEGTTAAAYLAFSKVKADIVLLETGLGGRLDATNVLDKPALTIITPISKDHTEFLGETIREIAGEKAGILKPGVLCVVAKQSPEAEEVILAKASTLNGNVVMQGREWRVAPHEIGFHYNNMNLPNPSLIGEHQYSNASTAIAALERLEGFSIAEDHIKHGITHTYHPARMQRLLKGKLVKLLPGDWELWLDGGHNPAGGETIGKIIENWQDKPLFVVCGMLEDKDWRGFLSPFAKQAEKIICIPIPNEPKSLNPEMLSRNIMELGVDSVYKSDMVSALEYIKAQSAKPARVLICGSLYLAGHVLSQ